MTTQRRNRLFAILILCFPFMVLVGFLISESTGPLPPLPPLPDPNGYDDLVKAGRMVSSNSLEFELGPPPERAESIATNGSGQ